MGNAYTERRIQCDGQLRSIMELWSENCVDEVYGGYLTCRNRDFSLYDVKKGAWGQARHIYTYCAMAEYDPHDRRRWLELARIGIDFVLGKMDAGGGRINYLVSQDGLEVLEGTTSIFSDAFTLGGLAKYIIVSDDSSYADYLRKMFEVFARNVRDPRFKDIAPNGYREGVCCHAVQMIAANTAFLVSGVEGMEVSAAELADACLNMIFSTLYDAESGCLLESKNYDRSYASGENSRFVNVGHSFESLWFCLELAEKNGDRALMEKICSISEATFDFGTIDGLLNFSFDLSDARSEYKTWKYEIAFKPDDRVSWAFAEAMVLFIMLHRVTGDAVWFSRFNRLLDYVDGHFLDKVHGDWFHALNRDGSVKVDIKGSSVKDAYHIPRAYMKIIENLDLLEKSKGELQA